MPRPEDCRFTKTHEWTRLEGDKALVGISDHAQQEITDVVHVELPKPGRTVKAGEACAVVESVKAAFDIYAPVSGEVVEVNAELAKDPAVVNQSPHDKGWFFVVRASAPGEIKALMDYARYQEFVKSAEAQAH